MNLSIVIATMNRPDAIKDLLLSLERQIYLPEEIIFIDQSKNLNTKELFDGYTVRNRSKHLTLKYILQEYPSLVKARNRGVKEASGDIVCFIDDDVILDKDYFLIIKSYFNNPIIGGVSGNVYLKENQSGIKWKVRKFLSKTFLLNNFNGKLTQSTFGYPIFEREIDAIVEVELFPGYSMNFRRELLLKNMSDEWLSGYSFREDVDLSYRISKDAKLIMVPDARFYHNASINNRLNQNELKKMQFKNYYYLFLKFKSKGFLSYLLFSYSILGIIIISFLEWILSLNSIKFSAFIADINALSLCFKGVKNER